MQNHTAIAHRANWLVFACVGVVSFLLHEGAHWLTGTLLGYDMVATPNRVWSKTATSAGHGILIVLAGPAFTMIQSLIGFALVMKRNSKSGFAWLYMGFFLRLLATFATLSKPNDESQLSRYLGLGKWAVPFLVSGSLLILVILASRRLRIGIRDQWLCFLIASSTVTIVIGVDKFVFSNS